MSGSNLNKKPQPQAHSFCIRTAKSSDLSVICQNEALAYPHPWSESVLKKSLIHPYAGFLMQHKKLVIGHMIFQQVLDEIHLHNLCVIPKYQGQGLGRRWLDYLTDHAKKNQVKQIILEVRISNCQAKKLYSKNGYREIGLRKNYYQNKSNGFINHEDALVMKAQI